MKPSLLLPLFLCVCSFSAKTFASRDVVEFQEQQTAPGVLSLSTPLHYQLYPSNIMPWIRGEKVGEVKENAKEHLAQVFDSLLAQSKTSLKFAFYGVGKQDWLIKRLQGLVKTKRVNLESVVDQKAGDLGEWLPENFTYPDTSILGKLLGLERIHPDTNSSGEPRVGSIMHNKFFIRDMSQVWMGSTNATHTELGNEYSANVSLLIDEPAVAQQFAAEFDQMFVARKFSTQKRHVNKISRFKFSDGAVMDLLFSPQDDVNEQGLRPFIRSAKRSIDIGMFFLTAPELVSELQEAIKRGVRVRVICDALGAAHPSSLHRELRAAGAQLFVENWGGKMHMKAAVADGLHTVIGSQNWSAAGSDKNDESTVIIWQHAGVAKDFAAYFQGLWKQLEDSQSDRGPFDPAPEGINSINSCNDGLDNDYDNTVDASDSGCTAAAHAAS